MVKSAQVSVSNTAPTKIEDEGGAIAGEHVFLRNTDATNSVFLGNSQVTAATGYELKAGQTIGPLSIGEEDDALYGKAAAAPVRVDVLAI